MLYATIALCSVNKNSHVTYKSRFLCKIFRDTRKSLKKIIYNMCVTDLVHRNFIILYFVWAIYLGTCMCWLLLITTDCFTTSRVYPIVTVSLQAAVFRIVHYCRSSFIVFTAETILKPMVDNKLSVLWKLFLVPLAFSKDFKLRLMWTWRTNYNL